MTEKEFIAQLNKINKELNESSGQYVCHQYTGSLQTFGRTIHLNGYFEKEDLENILKSLEKVNTLKEQIYTIENKHCYGNSDLGKEHKK